MGKAGQEESGRVFRGLRRRRRRRLPNCAIALILKAAPLMFFFFPLLAVTLPLPPVVSLAVRILRGRR